MVKVLVYAPHKCLVIQSLDPGCDRRSGELSYEIAKNIDAYKCTYISSETPRRECDNNRINCRNTLSRRKLRSYMKGDFVVIEVHTFGGGYSTWKLQPAVKNLDVVILLTATSSDLSKKIFHKLTNNKIHTVMISGSKTINDVQLETFEKKGRGVLLELNENLSLSKARKIGRLVNEILKKYG